MERDLRKRRAWLGLTIWLPLLLSAGISHAADTPAATDSDFDVVTVDLNAQTFNRVLPFDVPFVITGPVPQGVASLKVLCRKLAIDKKSRKVIVPAAPLRANDGSCWPGDPLRWRNTIDPAATNPVFRVLVPPLDAESSYQFSFVFVKKVTVEEAKDFADKVRRIVDTFLWGDPASGASLPLISEQLTDREIQVLRDQIVTALKEATGADSFQEPGTVFDDQTPFPVIRNDFNRLLQPVRNAQSQIDSRADAYQAAIEDLNPRLQALRAEPVLQRLKSSLAARAAADPVAQAPSEDVAAALSVADAPVLTAADRQSPEALAAWVRKSEDYFADATARIGPLRAFLASRLVEPDGAPKAMLAPLVQGGQLSGSDLASLAAMAQDRQLVGTIDRLLNGVGQSVLASFQRSLDRRAQAVDAVAREYQMRAESMTVVAGSTTGSFQTQSNNYISADTGIACAPELSTCSTYVGTNIYSRPVNKAAPLSQFGPFFSRASLSRRASLTLGLTANGIGDGKTRVDLFGSQTLVFGFGVRMTNSVRFTVGGLLFQKLSPNPLSNDKKLATTYFGSISFDVDVAPALRGIGSLFRP